MSRIVFSVDHQTECAVGWDPPLGTFFGQVYKIDKDGERVEQDESGNSGTLLWVGTRYAEIRTVDGLVEKLSSRVTLPKDIRRELFFIECD